jgi:pilus assembly protein Flp/PilA
MLFKIIRKLKKNESVATANEYGQIAALIAVAAIAAFSAVGTSLQNTFNTVSDKLDAASGSGS